MLVRRGNHAAADANRWRRLPVPGLFAQGGGASVVIATALTPHAISLLADGSAIPLSPGMAVTVEIKTGTRGILKYLFYPLVEVASKALKER
jgi:hypothetical protein